MLRPGLHTVVKCGSWDRFSLAAIAASRWTNCCLHGCCVSTDGALDEAPVVWLDPDRIIAGLGVCGAMTWSCGKVRKMTTKRSGKS
jgi:hypothetical protein